MKTFEELAAEFQQDLEDRGVKPEAAKLAAEEMARQLMPDVVTIDRGEATLADEDPAQ